MNEKGVIPKDLKSSVRPHRANALEVTTAWSYRSASMVAVELWLRTPEAMSSWKAIDAELVVPGRRTLRKLSLWQEAPSGPDAYQLRVVVEADATEAQAQGSFTLTVWGEGGTRSIVLNGVTFPF
jgi:uncharacterized protein (TIGR02268 family)